DGAVTVKAGADMHIENIKIDNTKLDLTDAEQLEDLVLEAVNRALDLAREKAAVESGKLLQQMMPPGGDFDALLKG
ncbi:MAG: YbaB/EbfC family nucleoid-associated protein, partial [Saprospiraceae bacterium]